ncbi:MAG: hypothetical protein Q8P18_10970 [Pseudomonadota bacterium]|nr:hypothetical protein [Pseudomonadota bacterium]
MNVHARRQVLECLRELADANFQQRVWIRGEGPEVSSYSELVCQLFDDTALGDVLESGLAGNIFGKPAEAELRRLSILLDQIPAGLDAPALLRHPGWQAAVNVAAEAAALVEQAERVRKPGDDPT